jgi:hypothetical protein
MQWRLQLQQDKEEKYLNFLFGRFTDETEIFYAYKEALSAFEALKIFQETKRAEYLLAMRAHVEAIMSFSARLSGRLKYVDIHWSEILASKYGKIMSRSAGDVHKELLTSIAPLTELGLTPEVSDQAQDLTSKILDTTFFKFPSYCWKKVGYITLGIIDMAEDITMQAYRSLAKPFPEPIYLPHFEELRNSFKREYAIHSGMTYQETDIPKDWLEKYRGKPDEVLDWGKDTLVDILKKMDFDDKVMAKAVVRLSGMLVCFAGALGKCASLVTTNPYLNDLSIKALAAGGTLALSPEAARKIAAKLGIL